MTLEGRAVVVTGGARGIGWALVEGFLDAGSRVAALDVSWDGADDHRERIEGAGGLVMAADVRDDESIERSFDATMAAFGTVDALVNNAGLRQRAHCEGRDGQKGVRRNHNEGR